jgi:NitT/TauT family transport system permease protein
MQDPRSPKPTPKTLPLIQQEWFQRIAAPVVVGLTLLIIWQLVCRFLQIPQYLFPAPTDIAHSLVNHAGLLFHSLKITLLVTLQAFALATLLGCLTAFLIIQSRFAEIGLFPFVVLLQVTPIVAIAPLIIILVKSTSLSLVICATLVALFPIISNTITGLRSVDPGLVSYFRMKRAGRLETLMRLQIPSALPFFLAGLRISSGLALIGAIVGEFVAGTGGQSAGLAYQILQSGFQLDIPLMFAALVLIACLGIAMFFVMSALTHALLGHWHESAMKEQR